MPVSAEIARAHPSRQQWRNFGPSVMLRAPGAGNRVQLGAHGLLYGTIKARSGARNTSKRFGGDLGGAIEGRLAVGWSMDRQGIRTSFDRESRRLKQGELSGSRRERVSRCSAVSGVEFRLLVERPSCSRCLNWFAPLGHI